MPAYRVAHVSVTDPKTYKSYSDRATAPPTSIPPSSNRWIPDPSFPGDSRPDPNVNEFSELFTFR